MKTAEEIADRMIGLYSFDRITKTQAKTAVVQAILADRAERDKRVIEVLEKAVPAMNEILVYRQHTEHCEIELSDFCTCGMKEAAERVRMAYHLTFTLLAELRKGEK